MDEFEFIDSIKQRYYRQSSTIMGVGDDAAVFRSSYQDIVTAVDTFVEDVHFSRNTMEPFYIGYRALAANISDMAAMGAKPISYLISIVIPKGWDYAELEEIYRGLGTIAQEYNLDLIGGDTVTGKELVISVTINGVVTRGKARYRSLMKSGDYIFVTGSLGDSAAGLELILNGNAEGRDSEFLINRHRLPTPRVNFSSQLEQIDRVALNDISDGIASEANELAEASKLTIYLDEREIPVSNALKQFSSDQQRDFMLSGGEDFELVGSVAPSDWESVKNIAKKTNTPIKKIGYVKDEQMYNGKVIIIRENGNQLLKPSGYVHQS